MTDPGWTSRTYRANADGPMRLYDTARDAVVPFEPGGTVTMYTCGITPYDATHVGHAATYLTYDVLQRRLRDRGHDTRCVRNVTDVDDDILRKARELGVHYLDLAAAETSRFDDDMRALEVVECWSEPRATSAIADIRGFIGMVLDRGHAYEAGGAVYFEVGTFEHFGQVSHLPRDEMLALAAERGGNPDDPHKRDALDFVLWQPSAEDEPAWESLWGAGSPRVAHRVLGARPARAGHHHRPPRRRCRPHLPPPRVRGRPVRGGHRRAVRAPLDAPGDGAHGRREDVQVARQPRVHQRPAQGVGPPGDPARHRRRTTTATRGSGTTRSCPTPGAPARLARCRGRRRCASTRCGERLDDDLDTPGAVAAIDAAAARG